MNSNNNYGVINEQGYPIGQFGFKPLNESEKTQIEKDKKKESEEKREK